MTDIATATSRRYPSWYDTCPECGSTKRATASVCIACYSTPGRQRRPLADRFWAKVQKGPGCWEWQGARHAFGHGQLWDGRRMERAHRVSWALANGPIPDGLWVLHHCDNPPCVRPDHLYVGTHQDNTDDRTSRGRNVNKHGSEHPLAVLTEDQVAVIKSRLAAGERLAPIAQDYGVSDSTVSRIRCGRTWRTA